MGSQPKWFPEEFLWVVGCSYKGLPTKTAPVRNLIGCNMSFRRAIFDELGSFREGMGHVGGKPIGCDETEFSIRVLQHFPGSVLLYQPDAKVFHKVPASRSNWKYFISRCFLEGQSKALVTHYVGANDGLSSERKHMFITLPTAILRDIAETIFNKNIYGIVKSTSIFIGLLVTAWGYVHRKATLLISRRSKGTPGAVPNELY